MSKILDSFLSFSNVKQIQFDIIVMKRAGRIDYFPTESRQQAVESTDPTERITDETGG